MRGHITKRGKGSYSVVIRRGKDPTTGKYLQSWFTVKGTKKEAEKKLAELLHQMDTGTFMKPGNTTVKDYLELWLNNYAGPNLSPRSYERYESIVRVHLVPALGRISLTQLKPPHVQKIYATGLNKGLSPRSVRYHHVVLHKALQTALKWGLVSRNAADGLDVPKAHRPDMQIWEQHDIVRFLETAKSTPYQPLFHLALFTGMRRGELLALRWSDIDLIMGQVSVSRSLACLNDGTYLFSEPKTARSRRTIALPPSAALSLKEHLERQRLECAMQGTLWTSEALVFSNSEGKPWRPNSISRAWETTANRAGVKVIRFHDARHTHASIMLKQGIHPKIVQERLGHSSIAVTLDTYSHVTAGLQEAAARTFDEAFLPSYNDTANKSGHEAKK